VVVNAAYLFDSYRGPLQMPAGRPQYDLHRVLLHEFGHVLGLDHVTNTPTGQAIMEPIISDLDHLGADDVAGVRNLYGADLTFLPDPVTLRVGESYSYSFHANNSPTSYSAIGLPPGLTLNAASGKLSGIAKTSGSFDPVFTARGPVATAYGTFPIKVIGLDAVPGLLSIIPAKASFMVADPIRPRIYVAGTDGIHMIDTTTFAVTNLFNFVNGAESSVRLSISADDSTLLFLDVNKTPLEQQIDLKSLDVLSSIVIPGNCSAVLEGLDNRAYVLGYSEVYQFDATTGMLQETFAVAGSNTYGAAIAISADRKTLFVAREGTNGELSSYNITGPVPTLARQIMGSYGLPTPSPDGRFLYYLADVAAGQQLLQSRLPSLQPSHAIDTEFFTTFLRVGPDGSIYESHFLSDALTYSISVFDPETRRLILKISPDDLDPDSEISYGVSDLVFDNRGKYSFASVTAASSEVWVFPANPASFPPSTAAPTKHLLNVSTRALDQTGNDAMIGGLIIKGVGPKKVLIRGIGPSLPITGAMSDPVLDLYDSSGKLLTSNDNWISNRLNILATQLAPSSEREAAITATLAPGAYTAIVHDHNDQPGLALVEVYDLDPSDSLLANISTRGKVGTGDNVMIAGFIVGGADPTKVLVRAIGPSLSKSGITLPLADPVLEVHNSDGEVVAKDDNWRATQQAAISATGLAPRDDRESALLATLAPGSYTAVVSGQGGTTGVALVEVYDLETSDASK
jgi:hypothetical protein